MIDDAVHSSWGTIKVMHERLKFNLQMTGTCLPADDDPGQQPFARHDVRFTLRQFCPSLKITLQYEKEDVWASRDRSQEFSSTKDVAIAVYGSLAET